MAAEDVAGWRDGRLVFRNEPLSLVAQQIGRHAGVTVTVDPVIADRRFSGVLHDRRWFAACCATWRDHGPASARARRFCASVCWLLTTGLPTLKPRHPRGCSISIIPAERLELALPVHRPVRRVGRHDRRAAARADPRRGRPLHGARGLAAHAGRQRPRGGSPGPLSFRLRRAAPAGPAALERLRLAELDEVIVTATKRSQDCARCRCRSRWSARTSWAMRRRWAVTRAALISTWRPAAPTWVRAATGSSSAAWPTVPSSGPARPRSACSSTRRAPPTMGRIRTCGCWTSNASRCSRDRRVRCTAPARWAACSTSCRGGRICRATNLAGACIRRCHGAAAGCPAAAPP